MVVEDYYIIGEFTGHDAEKVHNFLKKHEFMSKSMYNAIYVGSNFDDILNIAKLMYKEIGVKILDPAVISRLDFKKID